jgi:hypothetical protein
MFGVARKRGENLVHVRKKNMKKNEELLVQSHVSTLTHILQIFQECDITGGDIKEVWVYASYMYPNLVSV